MLDVYSSHIFPQVRYAVRRYKRKAKAVYQGLQKRQHLNVPFQLEDVLSVVPSELIIIQQSEESMKFGIATDQLLNGHPVMKELTINASGQYTLNVLGGAVPSLTCLGLASMPVLKDMDDVHVLFHLVKLVHICQGIKIREDQATGKTIEMWVQVGCDEDKNLRIRSISCEGITSLITKSNSCNHCQHMDHNRRYRSEVPT